MAGGYHEHEPEQIDVQLVLNLTPAINAKLGNTQHVFSIIQAWSQVVQGTNHKYRLQTHDGKLVQVVIYEPLPYTNEPPEITSAQYVQEEQQQQQQQ